MSVKIVTFVPIEYADKVRRAMGDAGAGEQGNYSHCSWSSSGIGRFTPLEGADPFIGEAGRPEEVQEERIEMICERSKAKAVIAAMKRLIRMRKLRSISSRCSVRMRCEECNFSSWVGD